jgi:FMN hydrolase / 5-amino-6-(5-phospho-D-ribitylamino)uracil phosphatase
VIEAVIFDWGGTLTPWKTIDNLAGWRLLADVLHAGDAERAAALADALLAAEDARWATAREEHRAFTVAQVLADAADHHPADVPAQVREAALAVHRDFWLGQMPTDPEVAPVLGRLRERGLKLGVLSSTSWPREWHEDRFRADGVLDLFDACVWTSDLEWTKPHPEAFRAAMDAVGVGNPARCVYIGDRPYDDVSGAKAVGMRAVFVPHSDIPVVQQVPVDVHPDAVLHRLADLPELIADW